MIGLSVSFCVRDIASGKVDINQVEKIIGATKCKNERDWDFVINCYRMDYWSKFTDKAEKILRQLLAEGRIIQPRLKHELNFAMIYNGCWVKSEEEIEWNMPALARA